MPPHQAAAESHAWEEVGAWMCEAQQVALGASLLPFQNPAFVLEDFNGPACASITLPTVCQECIHANQLSPESIVKDGQFGQEHPKLLAFLRGAFSPTKSSRGFQVYFVMHLG